MTLGCTSVQVGSVRDEVHEGFNISIQIIHTMLSWYKMFMQISVRQVVQMNTTSTHMDDHEIN